MRITHKVEGPFADIDIEVDFTVGKRDECARRFMDEARKVALIIDPHWEDSK